MNRNFIQIKGPFAKNMPVFESAMSIQRLGIEVDNPDISHDFTIDGRLFSIGKTGIIEFTNISIESLSFNQNEPETTMINYILIE